MEETLMDNKFLSNVITADMENHMEISPTVEWPPNRPTQHGYRITNDTTLEQIYRGENYDVDQLRFEEVIREDVADSSIKNRLRFHGVPDQENMTSKTIEQLERMSRTVVQLGSTTCGNTYQWLFYEQATKG